MIPAISVWNAGAAVGAVSCFAIGTYYLTLEKASSLKSAVKKKLGVNQNEDDEEDADFDYKPVPYMKLVGVEDCQVFYDELCPSCSDEVRHFLKSNPANSMLDIEEEEHSETQLLQAVYRKQQN